MNSNQHGVVRKRGDKKWVFSPSHFVLIIAVAVIVGFGFGMRSDAVLGAIAPAFGFKVATGTLDLGSVQETYRALKANFDGKLDDKKLIAGANKGMVDAAGDKYTVYMDKDTAKGYNDDLEGKFVGVGIEIGIRDSQPTVVSVLPDTPAAGAGLQANDVIAAVNDESSLHWTDDQTVQKVRGEAGTTVKMTVLRNGQLVDYTITRASITSPSVDTKIVGDIGIMTISRFDDTTSDAARRAAEEFKNKGVSKVILDLRGNGGGYVDAAQDVASLWLEGDVIVTERTDGKVVDTLKASSNAPLKGMKTVILVNGGTASASEIVSGALQDYKVATLVGEKTFGKGSVQTILDLSLDARLKVTIAKWYTPKGKNINKEGITPDKIVSVSSDDANTGHDPQMDAAKAALQ